MDTSQSIRTRIIALFKENLPQRQISARLLVPRSTVKDIIKKFKATNSIQSTRKGRCGRKSQLTMRDQRSLLRCSAEDPTRTARQLQACVGGNCAKVTTRTVRSYLQRLGQQAVRPRKCPSWTPIQKRARLNWCIERRNWSFNEWSEIVFSDESYIELAPTRPQYVRKRRWQPIQPKHCIEHRTFNRKILVWGCITPEGPASLRVLKGTMDSQQYIKTIGDHILPFRDHFAAFQQDNAPCHKSRIVTQFLTESDIQTIPWPSRSPDLNPIENIWHILKQKVSLADSSSVAELQSAIETVWYNDLDIKNACRAVYQSMENRIRACIKNKGGYIPH